MSDSDEEMLVETDPGGPAMQARSLIIQKLKTQQGEARWAGPVQLPLLLKYMHISAWPYTSAQLVGSATNFTRRGQSSVGWLLRLWCVGAKRIVLWGDELQRMASITPHPSLAAHTWGCTAH